MAQFPRAVPCGGAAAPIGRYLDGPATGTRIVVSPRTFDRAAANEGLAEPGELAHEHAHHALPMARHGWRTERVVFANGA
ncbi:MAG TPA: hypothetical protein VK844_05475, partial [Hyphomicrobiales bacterium]|nr:hypothetical protein [Hyphomicrobiales bacterium]